MGVSNGTMMENSKPGTDILAIATGTIKCGNKEGHRPPGEAGWFVNTPYVGRTQWVRYKVRVKPIPIIAVCFKRLDLIFLEIGVLRDIFTKRDPEFPGISGQVVCNALYKGRYKLKKYIKY
eukprot:sb/3476049/